MVRLDKEFESLEQGGMSHADFRALFESKLRDMEESDMDRMTPDTLYRKYLTKLNAELRTRIMSRNGRSMAMTNLLRRLRRITKLRKRLGYAWGKWRISMPRVMHAMIHLWQSMVACRPLRSLLLEEAEAREL